MKNIMLILLVTTSLILAEAKAFTLNNSNAASFDQDLVPIYVDENGCTNIGVTNNELLSYAAEGVNKFWNKAPSSRLTLFAGGLKNLSSAYRTDEMCASGTNCVVNPDLVVPSGIYIVCNDSADNFSSTSLLALTVPNNISGRTIHGALIMINDQVGNQFQDKTPPEMMAILAHEIGHAIGLGHSPIKDSLMYFQTIENREYLGWDDIDGVTYLYPAAQPEISIGSCGTITDINNSNSNLIFSMLAGFLFIVLFFRVRKTKI